MLRRVGNYEDLGPSGLRDGGSAVMTPSLFGVGTFFTVHRCTVIKLPLPKCRGGKFITVKT